MSIIANCSTSNAHAVLLVLTEVVQVEDWRIIVPTDKKDWPPVRAAWTCEALLAADDGVEGILVHL